MSLLTARVLGAGDRGPTVQPGHNLSDIMRTGTTTAGEQVSFTCRSTENQPISQGHLALYTREQPLAAVTERHRRPGHHQGGQHPALPPLQSAAATPTRPWNHRLPALVPDQHQGHGPHHPRSPVDAAGRSYQKKGVGSPRQAPQTWKCKS